MNSKLLEITSGTPTMNINITQFIGSSCLVKSFYSKFILTIKLDVAFMPSLFPWWSLLTPDQMKLIFAVR